MADDIREKYINPYTDFGFKKVFWDNFSVLKTAREKGEREGALKEKIDTIHRLQAMGLTVEQIAQGADMDVEEVKKVLQ